MELKKVFLTSQLAPFVGYPGLGTFTILHPKAKKVDAKLMLLCLWGDVDVKSALVTNVNFAQPATGMQVVMANPQLGQAIVLSDLLRQAFIMTRDHSPNDIRSRES
jgi:hypothetical protein